MVEIVECNNKKEQKNFLKFPINLYKGSKYFVPPLHIDEKKIFSPTYHYHKTSKVIFFNAYKDGKHVGRIQGIISYPSNEKWNQKRVRFTRFDSINDKEVSNALFDALTKWAKENGMEEINGPLGYSDLEREGLLIEGFNYDSTFEEQYNYDYYQELIESYGFKKEVDWVERRLYPIDSINPKIEKLVNFVLKEQNLRICRFKNINELIRKYGDELFDLIDLTYNNLYQTVPLTKEQVKELINMFKIIVTPFYCRLVVDKDDKLVAFGVCFPSIGKILRHSKGKLTPTAIIRILKAIRKPKSLDLGLIGVYPKYLNNGVAWVILLELSKIMNEGNIKYCETNLTLENNLAIQNCFRKFPNILHKRRRAYIKKI